MASVVRFVRREPRVALAIVATLAGAGVLLSVSFLELVGVVRVFSIVHSTADSASASRAFGIEAPSAALTSAFKRGTLVFEVGLAVWVLRVARRTADYRIGFWRTVGLTIPPVGAAVLAGALHEAIDIVVSDENREDWHRFVTACCSLALVAMVAVVAAAPGWSSIEPLSTLARWGSMCVGALVFVAVTFGVFAAAIVTRAWLRMTPAAIRDRQRRLADLARR